MATKYFIQLPTVFGGVEWDGTNLAEIVDYCEEFSYQWVLPITDNLDGTLQYAGGVINQGDLVTPTGVYSPGGLAASYQEVAAEVVSYDTTAFVP